MQKIQPDLTDDKTVTDVVCQPENPDRRADGSRNRRNGRLQLVLVVLVFLSPWMFALLWKSSGRINQGTLIEPPRPLPEIQLTVPDGVADDTPDLRAKWSWVVLAEGSCDAACVERLDLLRQVRIAQRKHVKRLRYMLIVVEPDDVTRESPLPVSVLDDHPDLSIRYLGEADRNGFLDTFSAEGDSTGVYSRNFVVDPLGNLMMLYEAGSEPEHLHRDMARLLKASHVG